MAENKWVIIGLFHVSGIIHVPFFCGRGPPCGIFFSRNLYAKKNPQQTNTSRCVNVVFLKSKVFKHVFQPWILQKKGQEKPITPLATVECFKQWYVIAVQQLRRTSKMFISFNIHFHVLCFFCPGFH